MRTRGSSVVLFLQLQPWPAVFMPIGEPLTRIGRDVLGSSAMGANRLTVRALRFRDVHSPFVIVLQIIAWLSREGVKSFCLHVKKLGAYDLIWLPRERSVLWIYY